jgi:hypothetical protein
MNMDQTQEKSFTNLGCVARGGEPDGGTGKPPLSFRSGIFDSNQRRKR